MDGPLTRPLQAAPLAASAGVEDRTPADPHAVEIVRQVARRRGGRADALAQIIQLAAPLDEASAAAVLDELAEAHLAAGDLNLAAETRQMLILQYPTDPRAAAAARWLVQTYSSSEVARAQRKPSAGADNLRRQLSASMQAALNAQGPAPDEARAARTVGSDDTSAKYAVQLAAQTATAQPSLARDPAFAFARSVAARRAGQPQAAQALLTPLKHRAPGDPWGDCAQAEAWLQDRQRKSPPKLTVRSTSAESRPHLDGVLDEPCWQGDDRGELCRTAIVRFAYDQQYLYVAVRCAKQPGAAYPRDERQRPHDGDVEAYDHVRLAIDLDRDYATWFELAIDSRGWTADRCAGDATWDPCWYVASAGGGDADSAAWTVEAAIPLAELTAEPPQTTAAWACAATRLPPASAGEPAPKPQPQPQEFGLLLFE
ncbi:MAG: hypothetical protein IT424_05710 [Pirellulales bacterium]|nr:hypothetical protein [Pirellulales bacterium]